MSDIYLDWDAISFKEFRKICNNPRGKRSRGWFKNRVGYLNRLGFIGMVGSTVYYRRSAGGRVHVRISGVPVGFYEHILTRVYLDDDHARVDMDITRWSKGETINRLFDTKFKNGKIGHAGPWIPWFTLRTGATEPKRRRGPGRAKP
jgi:hypothetical protein